MKKVAVVLAGSGVKDGSEIHEAVMSLWALSKNGIEYQCFAPDRKQYHVINHLTGEVANEERNILVEAARIARGNIKPLSELNVNDFGGILFPGGFGAAKNLFTYAYEGEKFTVDKEVEKVVKEFHTAKKPIVALCIAPLMIAKVLKAKVTIGNDVDTAKIVEFIGGEHQNRNTNEITFDEKNMVITTPCYMLPATVYDISIGIEKAVLKMKELMN